MEPTVYTAANYRDQEFISKARDLSRRLLNAANELKTLQVQATALDYANELPAGDGANLGILSSDVIAVVFTTADALETLLNAGHKTNLAKLL